MVFICSVGRDLNDSITVIQVEAIVYHVIQRIHEEHASKDGILMKDLAPVYDDFKSIISTRKFYKNYRTRKQRQLSTT